ncbi:MAG: hypothetical protein IKC28_00595 [Clostridia bacterium]|nr:hypothetical protein [Clostridia bacterium]
MLEAIMEITFFEKKNELYKDWSGYDATRILRPAFNLGAGLFSGTITSDETMYYWNTGYLVLVQFFTIDTIEVYREVETHLVVGKVYDIQMASRKIGKAVMVEFDYS